MIRPCITAILLALASTNAFAQLPGQYNPNAWQVPAPPPPPTPPAATPGLAPIPKVIGSSSQTRTLTKLPRTRPANPSRETFGDRATRCSHQAAAAGVPGALVGRYTGQCIDSP
jgi:hypothetical protein